MRPATLAIVSVVFPERDRGRALGIVAGASAFFAALGPVLGGLLTQYIDWRAVFLINVPLVAITIALTLLYIPALRAEPGTSQALDFPGLVTFAVGICGLTLGLGQSQQWGWGSPATLVSLGLGVVGLVAFVVVEPRRRNALMKFGLFRHLNFTAAVASQFLAGSIELATSYLLPFYLLLVVGLAPGPAGLALIPATVPIIVVAPLAGRWFDRVGGQLPLAVGFVVLAASSFALVAGFPSQSRDPAGTRVRAAGGAEGPASGEPAPRIRDVLSQFEAAHVYAFQLTFALMGLVAIVGALVCWLLVRKDDHQIPARVFSRRSRWTWATTGEGPGLTRKMDSELSGRDRQSGQPPPQGRAE